MPHKELYIDGIWMPSVTTITGSQPKPWLDKWHDKWGVLAVRKTKIAGAIGDEFHRCVESWLNTGAYTVQAPIVDDEFELPSTMPRIEGMLRSWAKWAASVNCEIHETEMQIISRTHMYSGTMDAVGVFNRQLIVLDWKTSSRIYPDMDLQLVAYAQAYNEMTGSKIKAGLIVHVSKDKPHFKVTTKEFKLGKRVFNKFLELREKFGPIEKRKAENK